MPKLVIKQDLPEPSFQEKLEDILRIILPILLLLLVAATAFSFYLANKAQTHAFTMPPSAVVEPPAIELTRTPVLEEPVVEQAPIAVTAAEAAPPMELPVDFCPLFGPEAGTCKPGADKKKP